MSVIEKQLLINSILLPDEILTLVKDFIFTRVRKISKNDPRYNMLQTIAPKTYLAYNMSGVWLQKVGSNICYLLYYSLDSRSIILYKRNNNNNNNNNNNRLFYLINIFLAK